MKTAQYRHWKRFRSGRIQAKEQEEEEEDIIYEIMNSIVMVNKYVAGLTDRLVIIKKVTLSHYSRKEKLSKLTRLKSV